MKHLLFFFSFNVILNMYFILKQNNEPAPKTRHNKQQSKYKNKTVVYNFTGEKKKVYGFIKIKSI